MLGGCFAEATRASVPLLVLVSSVRSSPPMLLLLLMFIHSASVFSFNADKVVSFHQSGVAAPVAFKLSCHQGCYSNCFCSAHPLLLMAQYCYCHPWSAELALVCIAVALTYRSSRHQNMPLGEFGCYSANLLQGSCSAMVRRLALDSLPHSVMAHYQS